MLQIKLSLFLLAIFVHRSACHYDLSDVVERLAKVENEITQLKESCGRCLSEGMTYKVTKLEDECSGEAPTQSHPITVSRCVKTTGWINKTALLVNADHGSIHEFCRVLIGYPIQSTGRYEITVKLNNIRPVNNGHPGVMFNVQDLNNFDFVFFRPQLAHWCYETGYQIGSKIKMTHRGACPDGPPRGTFLVRIVVHNNAHAQIYKNNLLLKTVFLQFPVKARAGIMVYNGYSNVIVASDFKIRPF